MLCDLIPTISIGLKNIKRIHIPAKRQNCQTEFLKNYFLAVLGFELRDFKKLLLCLLDSFSLSREITRELSSSYLTLVYEMLLLAVL
jgi:hypothetical protein